MKAQEAAKALFSGGANLDNMPFTEMNEKDFAEGKDILTLLQELALIPSRGEGRRLIQQGGISVNEESISDPNLVVKLDSFKENRLMIRKGKKVYHQVRLV